MVTLVEKREKVRAGKGGKGEMTGLLGGGSREISLGGKWLFPGIKIQERRQPVMNQKNGSAKKGEETGRENLVRSALDPDASDSGMGKGVAGIGQEGSCTRKKNKFWGECQGHSDISMDIPSE